MRKTFINISILLIAAFAFSCAGNESKMDKADEISTDTVSNESLIAIQDCAQQMSAELFVGQNDDLLNEILPDGKADASINVFLQKRKDRIVLFDAGLGESRNGKLITKLDSLGFAPDQITDICITHFHGDHIGGLIATDGSAIFKNAKLHFSNAEYEAWTNGELKGQNETVLKMLDAYHDRYEIFQGGDTIINGIVTIATPGHTPGHTMYFTGKELVAGDLLHAVALQVKHPEFSAKYDFNPELAAQTRKSVLDTITIPMAGMHFPYPYILKL